jgi:hypothetical protein
VRSALSVVVFTALLGFVGVADSRAQDLPPGMTMHRVQAGELDSAGWALARSTEGSFSISLPCKFNDYTFDAAKGNLPKQPMYMVGCQLPNGLRYAANRATIIDGKEAAEKLFSDFSFDNTAVKIISSVQGLHNGLQFKQLSVSQNSRCAEIRMLRAGENNILLTVETITGECFDFKKDAQRFFDSLEVGQ